MYLLSMSVDSRRLDTFSLEKPQLFTLRNWFYLRIYSNECEKVLKAFILVSCGIDVGHYIYTEVAKQTFLSLYNVFCIDQNVEKYVQNYLLLALAAVCTRLVDAAPFWTLKVVSPGRSVCTDSWWKSKCLLCYFYFFTFSPSPRHSIHRHFTVLRVCLKKWLVGEVSSDVDEYLKLCWAAHGLFPATVSAWLGYWLITS